MRRQIVDSEDTVIGAKTKVEMDYSIDIYRVSAVWLRNSKNELLIAQRSLDNSNGAGLWGPSAAGTVEEDESYEENIHKEVQEELGIEDITLITITKVFVDGERRYFCQVYSGFLDMNAQDFNLQKEEVASVKWISLSNLIKDTREHPENYIPGIWDSIKVLLAQ